MLLTVAEDVVLKDKLPPDMVDMAVNYLIETKAGNVYNAGRFTSFKLFCKAWK